MDINWILTLYFQHPHHLITDAQRPSWPLPQITYSYSNQIFSYGYVQLCSLEHDLKLLPAVITDWHVLEQVLTGGRIAEPDNLAM